MVTHSAKIAETKGSLLALEFVALVVGAAAGLVGAIFRLALAHADRLRDLLIGWAQGQAAAGIILVVVTCGVATSIAAWMVRRFSPQARRGAASRMSKQSCASKFRLRRIAWALAAEREARTDRKETAEKFHRC